MGWQDIEPSAFDRGDKRTLADLCDTLQEVKQIYINARTCSELGRDENAWCMDVAASRSSGLEATRQRQMVVSKRVYTPSPLLLQELPPLTHCATQAIPDHQPSVPISRPFAFTLQPRQTHRRRTPNRLCLSYSHLPSPGFESLYDRLRAANNAEVGHTTDTFTKRTALFSGILIGLVL